MTRSDFNTLCLERLIDPALALENEKVREALAAKDDEEVERLLNEEF